MGAYLPDASNKANKLAMIVTPQHRHRLFGLSIASDIPLPEAMSCADRGGADVTILVQKLDLPPQEIGIHALDGRVVLTVPGVARYLIREGREIIVDPVPNIPEKNVRLYLLGSAMGALLHQRGLLPLHANAIEIDGRGYAFVGESGAGKSTLAARFHDRGYAVLSDDVCVVRPLRTGLAVVEPALRKMRLCRDALIASGRNPGHFEPSFSGDPSFDKFDVPLPPAQPVPMKAVVLLEFGPSHSLHRMEGTEAVEILFAHTYRGRIIDRAGSAKQHWAAVIELLYAIDVFRWTRPKNGAQLDHGLVNLIASLRTHSVDEETSPLFTKSASRVRNSSSH
ncbi:hypothetical protein [Sphingomonas flavescens]|uniref:hypothetical protein n=1 Tax=Sphingomonas flavescens TaxID=3132797 RepID=UPI002805A172|nr:hypothetical protein [Sphingomonas limnosediminicola]